MVVSDTRNADDEMCRLIAELDTLGILTDDDARLLDRVLDRILAVRDCDALANVGREIFFTVEHPLHIALIDVAACHEHLAHRRDCVLAADGGKPDLDVFFQ